MVNKKKRKIEHLIKCAHDAIAAAYEEHRERNRLEEVNCSLEAKLEVLRKDHEEDLKTIADMTQERDHALALAVDNGKKLDEEIKKSDEIRRKMKEADGKIKRQKHLLEEARRASVCPADCKNRKNPNTCRTCTRYPKAKDKYEVAE